jgi:hypothetical protein
MLAGPGVYYGNGEARWIGPAGGLEIMYRTGRFAPEFGPGVSVFCATGILNALNNWSDKVNRIRLIGPGVWDDNDWALVAGEPDSPVVFAREGDPAPEVGEGGYVAYVSDAFANDRHEVLYYVRFGGPDVTELDEYGAYFGTYEAPRLILRGGDAAPYLPGRTLRDGAGPVAFCAMNDVGDFVSMTDVLDAIGDRANVLWLWRGACGLYVPLLEPGSTVGGHVVIPKTTGYLADYCMHTGGADGLQQSFNDRRQLAVHLSFADGTSGVYRIGPPLLGDMDGDGAVTDVELADFADWMTGPGGEAPGGCSAMDLDLDADLDLADYRALQAMAGEAR